MNAAMDYVLLICGDVYDYMDNVKIVEFVCKVN